MNANTIGQRIGMAVKQAGAQPPIGYMGMTHQQYMPQYQRRTQLTPEEQELIRRNKGNVIPKIFTSQADSPAVDMASPAWAGVGGAIGGGLLGAGLGAHLGAPAERMGTGAVIGGAAGTVLGAVVAAMKRRAQNATIEEQIRRIGPNGVRRDIEADPVYQADQSRAALLRAAMAGGGAAGVSKFASAKRANMDPLQSTATGAGLGAALGGALSFGDPGMMGRGALAGGSTGYLVSAVDRIVAKRQQRQRMEKPAGMMDNLRGGIKGYAEAIQRAVARRRMATGVGAAAGAVIPGIVGYGVGSALGGASNVGEKDPEVAKARRRRFAQVGGVIGGASGAIRGAALGRSMYTTPQLMAAGR